MKFPTLIQFIYLLSLVGQSFAQSSQIDSLKAILETAKEDTSKVNTLNALASNISSSDPNEAIRIGSEAKKLAEQLNFQQGLASALHNIGHGYFMQGNYLEASINWEQSLEIYESLEDKIGIASLIGNLGTTHVLMGNNVQAIDFFLKSLEIAESNCDSFRIVSCMVNIGLVYSNNLRTYDKALEYYSNSLRISESINYLDAIGIISFNLGDLYFDQELYDSALYYFEKSLISFDNTVDEAASLSYIGEIYAKRGDYQIAIEYQREALEIADKAGSKLEQTTALLGLAKTHKAKGDLRLAINYFEQAKTIAEEAELTNELRDAYKELTFVHAELLDYRNAYKYSSLLNTIEKTIYNTETDERIRNLMFSYQLEKKKQQIELQESQIIAKDATIKQQKIYQKCTWYWISGSNNNYCRNCVCIYPETKR